MSRQTSWNFQICMYTLIMKGSLLLWLIHFLLAEFSFARGSQSFVWPKPKSLKNGNEILKFSEFKYVMPNGEVNTLLRAFERYNRLIFSHKSNTDSQLKVVVQVYDNSEKYPAITVDESYSMDISQSNGIILKAQTIYGALHGLETLSQLVEFDFDAGEYFIADTPINIEDSPRYQHRGLLLDTSRHYQPVSYIEKVIDSLSFAKYNVLHWHVVDTQSFPFESQSYPKLWKGAYTQQERYSYEDILALVEYGRERGVILMIEFDMPGHAASWCTGYPDICPSMECKQPLDPSSDKTFPLIEGLLSEVTQAGEDSQALFPYELVHLGGDEVSYTCWEESQSIQKWQADQGFSSSEDTYEFFVDKVANITRSLGKIPVQWVEVFEHFGSNLNKDTIVHVWKEKSTLDQVLQAGYKALLSNQKDWYLDHLETNWRQMYLNEPTAGLTPGSDPNLIIGGESCMWGETVDPSDVMNTIWPRAAAVAEVLWTPLGRVYDHPTSPTGVDLDEVEQRLEVFRCLLTQRGIGAAPVKNLQARHQPNEPGSCYAQRRKRL